MSKSVDNTLARREQQVMNILYRFGEASAQEILEAMPKPPSYSAVRALLSTMMDKDLLKHRKESRRYLYRPTVSESKAKRSAVQQVITTFFDGKPDKLVASLLDPDGQKLDQTEIDQITQLIDSVKS